VPGHACRPSRQSSTRIHMTGSAAGVIVYRGADAIYLNITNRCSSACEFCLRTWTDGVYGESLELDQEPEADDVMQAIELAFLDGPADEVVFCGFGEPTMRLDVVLAVTEWLRLRRIPSRLDTNGHGALLNPDVDVPAALAAAGLTGVSVSLNAADPETYDRLCRPVFSKAYRAVLRFAEECVRHDIKTTLTAVTHPDVDLEGIEAIARAMGADFRARGLAVPRGRDDAHKGDER
jgi:GTP 3',8-cyclase